MPSPSAETMPSRSKRAVRNSGTAAIGQAVSIVFSFVTRTVFLYTLGAEYVGVHGLFTNILAILSLAEMGVGTAIAYALYRPLASEDWSSVGAIMATFRSVYRWVAAIVGVGGLIIAPFLGALIKGESQIHNLGTLYALFLLNSVLSYFLSYSRTLVIASQNGYLDVLNRTGALIVQNLLQVTLLLLTQDYALFLVAQIVPTVVSNVLLRRRAGRMFPRAFEGSRAALGADVRADLRRNVAGMLYHKFGSAVVATSTTLFISAFVGLAEVGRYSNYVLLTGTLLAVVTQGIVAVSPSVGDINARSGPGGSGPAFERLFFLNFLLVGGSTVVLSIALGSFIEVWIGTRFRLGGLPTALIVLNYFLYGMRQTSIAFINACGLFWKVRYKSIVEAAVSLFSAFVLIVCLDLGVSGALLSVTISTVATNVWWEPWVVWRHVLHSKFAPYVRTFTAYSFATCLAIAVAYMVTSPVSAGGLVGLCVKSVSATVVAGCIFYVLFMRNPVFRFVLDLLRVWRTRRCEHGHVSLKG